MTVLHRNETRGKANFGWLDSKHTFSFGHYYDPDRIQFGALRVLNDDRVLPAQGFGTHPHKNMEIVSIPLSGALRHEDSEGNKAVIRAGEVQAMSAGTGIRHSEYNDSETEDVRFLQIWILPLEQDIAPRYDQKAFLKAERKNQFQQVVGPLNDSENLVRINQHAYFSLADIDAGQTVTYKAHQPGHGIYIFVLEGDAQVDDQQLLTRDALGVTGQTSVSVRANGETEVLVIEVPMI